MQDFVTALQQLDHILRREEVHCDALAENIQRERQALRTMTLTDMAEVTHQSISARNGTGGMGHAAR
jgi:hypothetical protein